ncbi:MAG TPA: hypothetical protein VKR58_00445 [Aquella sp.]|nr:hypothetical protein [Aquella sp.]
MSLAYTKWSAEEDKKRGLVPDGQYLALIEAIQVSLSKAKVDKNGEPIPQMKMLVVDFLFEHDGRQRKMKGWVMLEGDMSWQFRHLCHACGLIDKYENDSIEVGELKSRRLVLDIKNKLQKDQSNNDVMRNVINDYLLPANLKASSLTPLHKPKDDFYNDDIPL